MVQEATEYKEEGNKSYGEMKYEEAAQSYQKGIDVYVFCGDSFHKATFYPLCSHCKRTTEGAETESNSRVILQLSW